VIRDYSWQDLKHAVDFAAVCARLALEHYSGEHREDLVAAIEIAERYVAGEVIDFKVAHAAAHVAAARAVAARAVAARADAARAAASAAASAADAARAAARAADTATFAADAADTADYAARAADTADYADYAARAAARAADSATFAADAAARAGVDQDEIDARWRDVVAIDLGADPDSDRYFAACAALSTGDAALADDLIRSGSATGRCCN